MKRTLLEHIAHLIVARRNCQKTGNKVWLGRHDANLDHLARYMLPRGSGVDRGTTIQVEHDRCPNYGDSKIILRCSFHHMNEHGFYDGWTEHEIVVTPSLLFGFSIVVKGRDRNQIKEYLHELYTEALGEIYEHTKDDEFIRVTEAP